MWIFTVFLLFPPHFYDMTYFTDEQQGQDKVFSGFTVSIFTLIGILNIYYVPEIVLGIFVVFFISFTQ